MSKLFNVETTRWMLSQREKALTIFSEAYKFCLKKN